MIKIKPLEEYKTNLTIQEKEEYENEHFTISFRFLHFY